MLSEGTAVLRAYGKTMSLFGKDYVIEHKNCPVAKSIENNILTVSLLFEGERERPDLIPDNLGWCVFSTVNIDLQTEEVTFVDYILPNGERMKQGKTE